MSLRSKFSPVPNDIILASSILLCALLISCTPSLQNEAVLGTSIGASTENASNTAKNAVKLYWFIPDGMRADPELFSIYEWAEQGDLPNIKRLMDEGSYGYSIPVFPSHTPVNFATLLTGSTPKVHGVADGPMHLEGRPLDKVAIGGFSSAAKKVDPIWTTMEQQGKDVFLLSMPGSTPPELEQGTTIRGRWGGWGADFAALNFESSSSAKPPPGISAKLFFFGPELTKFVPQRAASDWTGMPFSFSTPLESNLDAWGRTIHVFIYDDTNDSMVNYNKLLFSYDKKSIIADLLQGEWSEWADIGLLWQEKEVQSHAIFHPIIIREDGFFRARIVFDGLNEHITSPKEASSMLEQGVGPMIDFVDNFPPQLIYYDEDRKTFLEEMKQSFSWHTSAIPFIMKTYEPDVVLHDIYNPNQMLTSRWWMGSIDPSSDRFVHASLDERKQSFAEVKQMYRDLDAMIGEILESTDENTLIVISSDHGAIPINKVVRLNSLFAKEGLLFFSIDERTGVPLIDWNRSKAVYLQMDNIYISPNGLGGEYRRSSGEEYEQLRERVRQILFNLEDENGVKPLASITNWEDVENFLDLPKDRVGDFIIANEAGYGWSEEMTKDLEVFSVPLISGYKQAVSPDIPGMWTPFIIAGPGVKKGHPLAHPIDHINQYPTIMRLMGMDSPDFVEGKALEEVMS
jgi:predicted AlkP superfamily phosphohydrolase/phosphomutase